MSVTKLGSGDLDVAFSMAERFFKGCNKVKYFHIKFRNGYIMFTKDKGKVRMVNKREFAEAKRLLLLRVLGGK